jgi:hypothetical protein
MSQASAKVYYPNLAKAGQNFGQTYFGRDPNGRAFIKQYTERIQELCYQCMKFFKPGDQMFKAGCERHYVCFFDQSVQCIDCNAVDSEEGSNPDKSDLENSEEDIDSDESDLENSEEDIDSDESDLENSEEDIPESNKEDVIKDKTHLESNEEDELAIALEKMAIESDNQDTDREGTRRRSDNQELNQKEARLESEQTTSIDREESSSVEDKESKDTRVKNQIAKQQVSNAALHLVEDANKLLLEDFIFSSDEVRKCQEEKTIMRVPMKDGTKKWVDRDCWLQLQTEYVSKRAEDEDEQDTAISIEGAKDRSWLANGGVITAYSDSGSERSEL